MDKKIKSPILGSAARHWVNHLLFAAGTLFILFVVAALVTPEVSDPEMAAQLDYDLPPLAIILPSLLTWAGYAVAAYSEGWHLGSRDRNLVKFNHIPYMPFRGLWGCFLAQAPSALIALAAVLHSAGLPALQWALVANRTYNASYLWLFTICNAGVYSFVFCLPVLIQPLMAHWGYHNGYRFFSLYRSIVYKDPHKAQHNREKDRRMR